MASENKLNVLYVILTHTRSRVNRLGEHTVSEHIPTAVCRLVSTTERRQRVTQTPAVGRGSTSLPSAQESSWNFH